MSRARDIFQQVQGLSSNNGSRFRPEQPLGFRAAPTNRIGGANVARTNVAQDPADPEPEFKHAFCARPAEA
jgi:hypothetical protein